MQDFVDDATRDLSDSKTCIGLLRWGAAAGEASSESKARPGPSSPEPVAGPVELSL